MRSRTLPLALLVVPFAAALLGIAAAVVSALGDDGADWASLVAVGAAGPAAWALARRDGAALRRAAPIGVLAVVIALVLFVALFTVFLSLECDELPCVYDWE